jgi:hypothetical protein
MYLYPWLLTLFHGFFNLEVAAILMDKFLLEGEVFAVKCVIGILKYFESELKILTFT